MKSNALTFPIGKGLKKVADPVWLLVMFDLPTKTKRDRRFATQYRQRLLDVGFDQIQLSVYAKYLINASGVKSILPIVKENIPARGYARMFQLTDTQWGSSFRFEGPFEVKPEETPQVLTLFDTLEDPETLLF